MVSTMVKCRRSRKAPPDGWELIEPTLDEFEQKMREAEAEPHEGKRRVEALWPIFRIHHQKSRYIYDLYYKRQAITKGSPLSLGPFLDLAWQNLWIWLVYNIYNLVTVF
ncbi:unnamed protein product [Soboliphyme baturini]|uniref:Protein BUD31 homolog n=1 Tax=Soboliphyme baturini TaxID=241478 RepID=A0A183IR58_9BILA|nr:unnamed protein product [Soboliphyme baturini]